MALALATGNAPAWSESDGIHKIQHVVVIMQENRSFDSYFGTFPGADGIPAGVCVPSSHGGCVKPVHDPSDVNLGGPHGAATALADIDGGRLDGFMRQAEAALRHECPTLDHECTTSAADVMGWHDQRELPLYWDYAHRFTLLDHLFESNLGWSLPSHLFMVSGWAAACDDPTKASTCHDELRNADNDGGNQDLAQVSDDDDLDTSTAKPDFGWTDLTFLLHRAGVSWRYYVTSGSQPDCASGAMSCAPLPQDTTTPEVWNPLPDFVTVHQNHQLGNIQPTPNFVAAARAGTLPAVSWVVPNQTFSEHPPAKLSDGQAFVKELVDAVANGPN